MTLNETPRANRLHIGLFGKRNTGKSSLINALTGQKVSLVSDVAGTTTDPVYKSMEIHGIGPCVLIDTPALTIRAALEICALNRPKRPWRKQTLPLCFLPPCRIKPSAGGCKCLNSKTPL